ncbi:leader peptidase (prepilin peptidase)/N-methyltransferase [Mobilisporobacter senegalensis]|uniref:Leader peptidase (Prepilin peptidase)/N-methyltransferase n=1 Tax=Mobilisporobacter senegalensis TaxID=1329262 RepID=A0A3N1XA81_9FIRM|nr:prepilin peptidase [Mobilisporobacter senegalensis]ROR23669.1 leader peptidase (prepilin peptidase)/N-methyltransferase [Mobilisporobacter senegalensis]
MNIYDTFVQILLGVILVISSIKDIKRRRISMSIIVPGIIILLICLPFRNNISIVNGLFGTIVGISMIGIGRLSRWQIGMGDGIVLILTGIGLGFWENAFLFLYALLLIFLFSVILLFLKKITKKTTLPFIPFIFLGYIGVILS